jgi:hypothetical protein
MSGRAIAIVRSTVILLGAAVILGAWAIPTFAGRSFVEVTVRIVPIAGAPPAGREIVLPDGSTAPSGRLRVDIEITNRYPLPVTVDFRGSAFGASLVDRTAAGGEPAWRASSEDPLLEQGDESPDGGMGGDSARVIRLAPGTTLVTTDGLTLDLATSAGVASGIYSLEVTAYGIAGSPQPISIVDAAAFGGAAGHEGRGASGIKPSDYGV